MADLEAVEDGRGCVQMPQPPQEVDPLLALFEDGLCVVIEGQPAVDDGPKVLVAANPLHGLSVECQLWNRVNLPPEIYEELLCLPHVYLEKVLVAPLLQIHHFFLKMGVAIGGVDQCSVVCKLHGHAHTVRARQVIGL